MPPNSPKIPDAEIDIDPALDRGRGAGDLGERRGGRRRSRSSSSSSTPRPWASPSARPRCPRTSRPSRSSSAPGRARSSRWPPAPGRPLVAVGGHKQVLLYHTDDEPPRRRPPVPRGVGPRPEVQPQRRPAAGRRRPGRPVGPGGRLGREDGQAGLRDRQGIRRRPRRRHQPRPRPGRPRRPGQGRPGLQHGRRPAACTR